MLCSLILLNSDVFHWIYIFLGTRTDFILWNNFVCLFHFTPFSNSIHQYQTTFLRAKLPKFVK
jgi:hypothetical protein